MRLAHGRHLAFCPDVPCGGSWAEVFAAVRAQVPTTRDAVCGPGERFGLGLWLGSRAAHELRTPRVLARLQNWLQDERCEVLTLNDALLDTDPERLAHACRLLDLLGELLPDGLAGSVGTAPGLCHGPAATPRTAGVLQAAYAHFIRAAVHAAEVSGRTGRRLSLALEWDSTGMIVDTAAAIRFLEPLVEAFPDQFGVCFDTARCVVGFEEAATVLGALDRAEIPVVKLRLGKAWRMREGTMARATLQQWIDGPGPRLVAMRQGKGPPTSYKDLRAALATPVAPGEEWRWDGLGPTDCPGAGAQGSTGDEVSDAMAWLAVDPSRCPHLEVEARSWATREGSAADQSALAFRRTLELLGTQGLA